MHDETLLADLLLRWEELHDQGRDVPAEELARDHPQLVDLLRRRIAALETLGWVRKEASTGLPGPSSHPGAAETPPPEVLAGRYRLERRIAEGGFGHVWQGRDLVTGRAVAVKIAKQHRVASPEHREAFRDEAALVARLRHPAIVPVLDVGQDGDFSFHVSELIDGEDLGTWLLGDKGTRGQGDKGTGTGAASSVPLSPCPLVSLSVKMVARIARALEHAHQLGLVHRDVKPANVLVDRQGQAFLTDFGIAVTAEQLRLRTVDCAGTLAYMAPEQANCDTTRIDARSDVYGLGVLLYELLTGRTPFQAATPAALREQVLTWPPPPPRSLDPHIPPELEAITLRCLAKLPADRFQRAAELADALEAFAAPLSADPPALR